MGFAIAVGSYIAPWRANVKYATAVPEHQTGLAQILHVLSTEPVGVWEGIGFRSGYSVLLALTWPNELAVTQ